MGLHHYLFPNCSQAEIKFLREELDKAEDEAYDLRIELKKEVARNRTREDQLINALLTSANAFGVPPRAEEQIATKQPDPPDVPPASADSEREAAIDARVLELEGIYERRGRNVPRPEIRKMVEANFVYLMDDDRVEL